MRVWGSGFRVKGSNFGVLSSGISGWVGFRVKRFGSGVLGSGISVRSFRGGGGGGESGGFGVQGLGCRLWEAVLSPANWGLGLRVQGSGVQGLGFTVCGSGSGVQIFGVQGLGFRRLPKNIKIPPPPPFLPLALFEGGE